jgi:thymidylate synthase (FAD)
MKYVIIKYEKDMTIKIIDITKNPLQRIGEVASACWNSNPMTVEQKKVIALGCIESGHGRVLEFPDMTIEISGYSARMIRELYTHHIGVSRLQESTRYVNYYDNDKFRYYIPDSIKNNENALIEYQGIMHDIQNSYKHLRELNIPQQDCANILPLGLNTKVILKINLRALLHMAELRLCKRALPEFQDFMIDLKIAIEACDEEWYYIIGHYYKPKCQIVGYCIEKNSCFLMPSKQEVIG